jgi:hypothetical protein
VDVNLATVGSRYNEYKRLITRLHQNYDCTQIVIVLSYNHQNEIDRIQNVLATHLKWSSTTI